MEKMIKMVADADYLEIFSVARPCTLNHLGESTFIIAQKMLRSVKFLNLENMIQNLSSRYIVLCSWDK
jgi:hypothetical protein